jgi:hypothetical protein
MELRLCGMILFLHSLLWDLSIKERFIGSCARLFLTISAWLYLALFGCSHGKELASYQSTIKYVMFSSRHVKSIFYVVLELVHSRILQNDPCCMTPRSGTSVQLPEAQNH